jgi:hypothetical protein
MQESATNASTLRTMFMLFSASSRRFMHYKVTLWFAWNLSTLMAMTYAPQNVPHRQRLHELENAGGVHQEQGSAQVQRKKSRRGLHG